MPPSQQSQSETREHLAEQLDWRFAERDDVAVEQALYGGEAVDAVHTLDEAGLLDGFFAFLPEAGMLAVWQEFRIDGVQRTFLPAIYFVLLYGTRVLFGIESSNALPALLFSNVAVMTLLGFNATAVAARMTTRGQSRRTGKRPVSHRIVNRQMGEILPDSRSLARQAGHLAAAPLLPRHHKPPAPVVQESGVPQPGTLNPPFPITCSKGKASSAGANNCAKKTVINSSSSSLTVTPSTTPMSSWSSTRAALPHPTPIRLA